MQNISATIPEKTKDDLERILRRLAGSNPAAQQRVHIDADRLYAAARRVKGIVWYQKQTVDLTTGRRKLALIKGHAEKLAKALENLPINLQDAWPDADRDIAQVRALLGKSDAAQASFKPRSKKGTRAKDWDARGVDSWAAEVFKVYTGRKKASRSVDYDSGKTSGQYLKFLSEVFDALNISASAAAVIKARRLRENAEKKPQD
jgi:hypothetical protein